MSDDTRLIQVSGELVERLREELAPIDPADPDCGCATCGLGREVLARYDEAIGGEDS